MQRPVDNEHGQTATTQALDEDEAHQNPLAQGRLHSSVSSVMALTPLLAGRRASSPSPRPKSPNNSPFRPSSSQQSAAAAIPNHTTSKAAGRLSDVFASKAGRVRTLSTTSDSKNVITARLAREQVQDDAVPESSFGIDADPFASHPSASSTHVSRLPVDLHSSPFQSATTIPSHKKQRGSILFAASDALGFGRVGASISKRMNKRTSTEQSSNSEPSSLSQPRRGLPWKGKPKAKGGHWALQPHSSTHVIPDVIEISAAKAGLVSVRDEQEENERRERDRLREAAAESIGISPLFREDASSRRTDSIHFEDESIEDGDSKDQHERHADNDAVERLRMLNRSGPSVNGTAKHNGTPSALQLQQTRESRHNRSSSLSGIVTPTTPSPTSNWPLPPLGPPILLTNGRTPKGSTTASLVQAELPAFPCLRSALAPLSRKSSILLKFHPSSSLLTLGFSRQWRTRVMVLTTPPRPRSPSLSGFRSFTPTERWPSVCHLHMFKSSAAEERELERLEFNESSVVFVAEEEVGGKRSVVKVGGVDFGGKRKELNEEENGQTMWLLSIADASEAQGWITTLKSAVLDQRAEKAGFGMPTHSATTSGPNGDLDVMLSMRAQDAASTIRTHIQTSSRTLHEEGIPRNTDSPTPTVRSWSGEGRPSSPSGRIVSLKSLFSVPGRARSMSHGTNRNEDDSPTTPVDAPSFTSRGTTLLNMMRTSGANALPGVAETDSRSAPSSPVAVNRSLPVPIPYPGPILSTAEMNLDKASVRERDREVPEWYSIQNRQRVRGDSSSSLGVGPTLLPPPRSKRPWTSAGLLSNSTKRASASDNSPPTSRRSFQSAISLHGARLSLDGKTRPSSPVDSLGTAHGTFSTPELASKRASLSSSVSSFVSTQDRDQLSGRSASSIQRRVRAGKLPKMLAPPAGPPPSVPTEQVPPGRPSSSSGERNTEYSADGPLSRSSSLRSAPNSEVMQNGIIHSGRRLSTSSALSAGSSGTPQKHPSNHGPTWQSPKTLSPKRTSIPPPPRPAPTFALPPTPPEVATSKQSGSPARRTSFRESLSHRSLRFSLSPPPSKDMQATNDSLRQRSLSNGSSVRNSVSSHASSITVAPPAPPPTGPLPPTPRDAVPNRYSIRERLRMKSAPSTPHVGLLRGNVGPPTTLPGSPPLVTVSSVASLKESTHSIPIGEPITAIPKDLNFLNMSSPIESSGSSCDDVDFLNISTPLTATFPKQILNRSSGDPPPEHCNGSPPTPEMTALPPPPRRPRNGTISEKDRERGSQSLSSNIDPAAVDGIMPINIPLETVTTV